MKVYPLRVCAAVCFLYLVGKYLLQEMGLFFSHVIICYVVFLLPTSQ